MIRSLSTAVLLLLLALPGVALAQGTGTLAGRVFDGATGEALPGANVRIVGTSLGAATNANGEYRVIGVPVGAYDVVASFAGFAPTTERGVAINNGYTRELDFRLQTTALGEVVVTYERPLLQSDAIGAPRIVSGEDLQNLPVRGVANVAALQNGVVSTEGSSNLNIRGSRSEEVAYFVDGVRISGSALLGVNQGAVQEQEMLIGTIPARYGDVQSGVISITTKTGRQDFFGSAEFVTSTGLDAYGYNLGSLSLGGPVVPGSVGFFLSGELTDRADSNPYGLPILQLNDEAYNRLQQFPQTIQVEDADGALRFVPFPNDLLAGQTGVDLAALQALMRTNGLIAATDSISSTSLFSAAEQFTSLDQFETTRGKSAPLSNLTLNGNLNFDFGTVGLRLGGGYATQDSRPYSFTNSLYNRDDFSNNENESYRLYGTFRQRLSNVAFYQIQGEFQDARAVSYPKGFSSNVEDVLLYGDAAAEQNAVGNRYYVFNNGQFVQQFARDSGARPGRLAGVTYSLPGRPTSTAFSKSKNQQYRFSGSATTQVGVHQIEFGGEFQQETRRFFSLNGFGLAAFVNDGAVESPLADFPNGVSSYTDLPFSVLRTRATYYGYNFNGTQEVDDQNIDTFFPDANGNRSTELAPYQPRYYAGYIQDKIEFQDLVIQLGLRVDAFDNNTFVLRDEFAPTPIVRAGSLASVPNGIESDWAVYYNGTDVVGFRDLNGTFYDTQGSQVTSREIQTVRNGQVQSTNEAPSTAFKPYEAQVSIMPRLGVSFPVTDRALFFASYNVVSQRPTENSFAPLSSFEELDGQTRVSNPGLDPERTTQYELGFRQRLGERAAVSISGFYRTQENKISVRPVVGGFPAYSTYFNADFTTTQGAEFNFDLRRTNNLALSANYTLSFAAGTGSDASSTGTATWRGTLFPQSINPADFDQRHTANLSLDYRYGKGEGPMVGNLRLFENFGVNVLGQFGSGQRYTILAPNPGFNIADSFTANTLGDLNSGTLPATSRIDVRIDRQFDLGFADSKLRAYLNIQNLLDTRNVLAVYRGTGVPDDDGFIATNPTLLDSPGDIFHYQQFISGPVNVGGSQSTGAGQFYSAPRQVRLGFLFDF
jgi:outer membrane receptor protein involved in Fe transport